MKRRRFLGSLLALAARPQLSVPLNGISTITGLPSAPMPLAAISSNYAATLAETAWSAFAFDRPVRSLSNVFDDLTSEEEQILGEEPSSSIFQTLDKIKSLPEDRRGEELDDFMRNYLLDIQEQTAFLHQLLLQPEDYMQAAMSYKSYNSTFKYFSEDNEYCEPMQTFTFNRKMVLLKLAEIIDEALTAVSRANSIRISEKGIPLSDNDYFCSMISSMKAWSDEIEEWGKRNKFSDMIKYWLEAGYVNQYDFRCGLYNLPTELSVTLQSQEEFFLDPRTYSARPLGLLHEPELKEGSFGSVNNFEEFYASRKADPALEKMIEDLANSFVRRNIMIKAKSLLDPSSAIFNMQIGSNAGSLIQKILESLREIYPESDIRISKSPQETTHDVFMISYTDSRGKAAEFSEALTEALQRMQRQRLEETVTTATGMNGEKEKKDIYLKPN